MELLSELALVMEQNIEANLRTELSKIAPINDAKVQASIGVVECLCEGDALYFRNRLKEVAAIAKRCWLERILIFWPGCANPWPISASMAGSNRIDSLPRQREFFIPELQLTWADFYYDEKPIYINSRNNKVLFANQAGLNAQQKSLSQFAGESVYLLNNSEELDSRIELIFDGELENQIYEYKAFRWFKVGEEYRRKVMDFASFFGEIEWCDESCWYSAPQQAVETGVIV